MKSNSLYDSVGVAKKYVDNLAIPFDKSWKDIGVNLSGGADSALLTALLCQIISENNYSCKVHIITYHRCWKTRPWQIDISLRVFEKISLMFPRVELNRDIGYIPPELEWGAIGPIVQNVDGRQRSGDQITVASFNEFMIFQKKLNAVFEATSRNPDTNFPGQMPNRNKSPEDAEIHDLMFKKNKGWIISPFRFIQKDWIYRQYKNRDWLDLYQLTRSCEGEFNDINYLNYKKDQLVPICGSCFWCLERAWAEEQNE